MNSEMPRSEYPRPQCQRSAWLCLNGEWEFALDPGDSGWSVDYCSACYQYNRCHFAWSILFGVGNIVYECGLHAGK
jgi:hypothetical protein